MLSCDAHFYWDKKSNWICLNICWLKNKYVRLYRIYLEYLDRIQQNTQSGLLDLMLAKNQTRIAYETTSSAVSQII